MGYRLQLTKERAEFLSKEIGRRLEQALQDRKSLESEWEQNNDQYEGKIVASDFPWPGASAFFVPLTETYVNAVTGRLTDAVHSVEPTFSVRNVRRSKEWADTAKWAQDWVEYKFREVLKFRDVTERFAFALSKHGTAFMFAPWQVLLEKRLTYSVENDEVSQQIQTRAAGPTVIVPAIQDVLIPKETTFLRSAPWKAYRVYLTEDDLRVREFSNVYNAEAVERVLARPQKTPDDVARHAEEAQGYSTAIHDDFYEIWEVWALLTLPGQKFATEVIVPFHLPSKTPLSLLVNYYPYQFVPLFSANFQRAESGPYGRGVCKMVRSGNREVNDLHKHRVDNAMVANTRAYKVKSSTYTQLPRKFKLWPGRLVPVLDMNDFEQFAMADVYPSTMNEEMLTRRTLEQLVGLVDFSLTGGGGESLKRVGATPALVAVQESGRVLNYRLNHLRFAYANLAAWQIELDAHFRPMAEITHVLGPAGAVAMQRLFDTPPEVIRGHMAIELTASSATVNREVDKQSDLLLVNIMNQYADRYASIAQAVAQVPIPELRQVGIDIARMMNELHREVLRDFNKRNDALILAELNDVFQGGTGSAAVESGMAGPADQAALPAARVAAIPAQAGGGQAARAIGALSRS